MGVWLQFYPVVLAVLVVGVVRQWRRGAPRPWLSAVGLLSLVLASWPPVTRMTFGWVERDGASMEEVVAADDVDLIVVLSGGGVPVRPGHPRTRLAENSSLRTSYAAALSLRTGWPVLATGGPMRNTSETLAGAMRTALLAAGVAGDDIGTEEASRNTYENATGSARVVREWLGREPNTLRIALVTEGYHMTRAAACFRAQGFDVVEAPCGRRSQRPWSWSQLLPTPRAMTEHQLLVHEAIGLLWYRARGRLSPADPM